ncbi:MAG: hypothetical protein Q7U73_08645 [Rubrivivax sp.]|nr:hypothetical protein [Rubrivivax sp.]
MGPAVAAGLGGGAAAAVLGQPLDFPVQVRLEPDEVLTPECLSAEVTLGDRRVPTGMVRTALEMTGPRSARVRVLTTLAIDEPVVGVLLSANCGAVNVSRRFVVLADPPLHAPAAPAVAAFTPAFAAMPVDAAAVSGAGMALPAGGAATTALAVAPADPRAASPVRAAPERPDAARPGRAAPRGTAARAARRAERRAAARRTDAARPALSVASEPAAVAASRLRLEAAEVQPVAQTATVDEALAAVAQAASAARAAASAASVAAARIASLESNVDSLRKEAGASRELATQLRERLVRAEQSSRWTWPLLALVLLLTALASWLAWRLNAADRARQRGWQAAAAPAAGPASEQTPSKLPTAPIPFVTAELTLPASAAARPRPLRAWPAPAPVDTPPPPLPETRTVAVARPPPPEPEFEIPMQRTEPLPPQSALDLAAARDVSIEELIDLEQQAEFFVVLGQDDAAIDLLVEHLRNTGGGSPLPYLKLLEIYHRRGELEHYERTRTRFNHRFNAYAPDWGVDLQAGRSLDTYPGVIPRLQQVWSRPLDAMAELEALLFRKSRGELFDLPAYREVLFLYSMARDLLDREAATGDSVDLLLPLSDGGEFSSTSPAPFIAAAGTETPPGDTPPARVVAGREGRATAPLDFDLTADTGPATSLFGPLDDKPDRPSQR